MKLKRYWQLLRSLMHREAKRLALYHALEKQCPNVEFQENLQVVGDLKGLHIGSGAKVNRDAYLNLGGASYGGNGHIKVGAHGIIGSKTTLYAGGGSIVIGDYCDIGVGALLLAHSRKSTFDPSQPNYEEMFDHSCIEIGKCCNIASGAVVLGDTQLGDYCIVAAGAVVQGKYPDYTTIVAQPGRPVPRYVDSKHD